MKVALVASEAVPYAKTGGLADVVGALRKHLPRTGVETFLYLPRYRGIKADFFAEIEIPFAPAPRVKVFRRDNAFFIDHPAYFDREGLYGTSQGDYPDNLARFTLFNRAVECLLRRHPVDIIHGHDWQAGLLPLFFKERPSPAKTVFTIHNLGYQGRFPADQYPVLGLPDKYFTPAGIEFYGDINFLKSGIVFADAVTTVSENYSREIQTPEFGCGLEGVIRQRASDLRGIINGIDYDLWDPARDPALAEPYRDFAGKQRNKQALVQECNIDYHRPLIGMVSRIAEQKGFDLLGEIFDEIICLGYSFVLLGTGDEAYEKKFKAYEQVYRTQVSVSLKFDDRLARRIYAGCDFFLMPSRYEPCGLGQLIGLRYGAVPVVRRTGGLADTVQEFNPETMTGNGFVFNEYQGSDLLAALERGAVVYRQPDLFAALSAAGMTADFSWNQSALKYRDLYQAIKP